jgi:hypothetical protein
MQASPPWERYLENYETSRRMFGSQILRAGREDGADASAGKVVCQQPEPWLAQSYRCEGARYRGRRMRRDGDRIGDRAGDSFTGSDPIETSYSSSSPPGEIGGKTVAAGGARGVSGRRRKTRSQPAGKPSPIDASRAASTTRPIPSPHRPAWPRKRSR